MSDPVTDLVETQANILQSIFGDTPLGKLIPNAGNIDAYRNIFSAVAIIGLVALAAMLALKYAKSSTSVDGAR